MAQMRQAGHWMSTFISMPASTGLRLPTLACFSLYYLPSSVHRLTAALLPPFAPHVNPGNQAKG